MTIDSEQARRDMLAAAAIAYAPATDVPRERALIQSAISSLVGTFGDGTFTADQAIIEISKHGSLPELRPEIAKPLFEQLMRTNTLTLLPDVDPPVYRFTQTVIAGTRETQTKLDSLIAAVINDLFADLSLTPAQKTDLREKLLLCIAWTMKEFGAQYAYQLVGKADAPVVVDRDELVAICTRPMGGFAIPNFTPEMMAEAITELFARREPHFAQFVFSLTQCYYYMRLMGLDGGLAQLSADRFHGAEFFLDTNLLVAFLFEHSRHHRSVLELWELCQQQHISLHTTETTLDELRRLVYYFRSIKSTFDAVPDDLVDKTRSVFLRTYRYQQKAKPELTVDAFFESLSDARGQLDRYWEIRVLDDPVEHGVDKSEYEKLCKAFAESSKRKRHQEKRRPALEHDAHMFLLVRAERVDYGDKSAWLLTLDTSLAAAAGELQDGTEACFCMSLDGFLQIMSPYVRADHRQSFADLFVELVGRNLFPPEAILELEDFRMFTDMDLTIRALPGDDVQKVIRRVKKSLGGNLDSADRKNIAYEVQKALADPTLKYQTEIENKVKRLQKEYDRLNDTLTARESEHASELDRVGRSLDEYRVSKDAEMSLQEAAHENQVASVRLELMERLSSMEEGLRLQKHRSEALEAENSRRNFTVRILVYCLKAIVSLVTLVPLVIAAWLIPDDWVSCFRSPFLARLGVSVAAGFSLIAVFVGQSWVRIITIVLSLLSLFAGLMRALM